MSYDLLADKFDFVVGTDEERATSKLPPGYWINSNPFATKYDLGYHTGLDLNLNFPYWNADKGQFVRACANGVVLFAERIFIPAYKSWGNIINILHTLPSRKQIVSRYAHVDNMLVKQGDIVVVGQIIAQVSNAFGQFTDHLHFDLCTNVELIKAKPYDWPAFDLARVYKDYVDPISFIRTNRIVSVVTPYTANKLVVSSSNNLNIRSKPSMLSTKIGSIPRNTEFIVDNKLEGTYMLLNDYRYPEGYVVESELQYIKNLEGNILRRSTSDLTRRRSPSRFSTKLGSVEENDLVEIIGLDRNGYTALSNKLGWVLTEYLVNP